MTTKKESVKVNSDNPAYKHPVFIDASYSHGIVSVGIYNIEDNTECETVHFKNAANALNYAFLLKARHGLIIAHRAMSLILWAIQRKGDVSTRSRRKAMDKVRTRWESLKAKHPDAILLLKADGGYRCWGEDAEEIAQVLSIKMDDADNGSQISFPVNMLDEYLPRLIKAGLRIAVCDDIEESKPKTAA